MQGSVRSRKPPACGIEAYGMYPEVLRQGYQHGGRTTGCSKMENANASDNRSGNTTATAMQNK